MNIKNTVVVSMFLHVTFSVALFLYAGFLEGSGKMFDEKVFYIDITSEISMPDINYPSVKAEKIISGKSAVEEVTSKPILIREEAKQETEEAVYRKQAVEEVTSEPILIREEAKQEEEIVITEHMPESEIITIAEPASAEIINETDTAYNPAETIAYEGLRDSESQNSKEETFVSNSYAPSSNESIGIPEDKGGGILPPAIMLLISNAIEKAKTYPILARRRGIEGTVHVGFRISSEGEPQEIEVIKSSGYKVLDKATVKVVAKAAPYPYIDNRVEVPITYKLRDQ